MINLDDFNEIGVSSRGRNDKTYIWISSGKDCTLNFSSAFRKEADSFFGGRVIIKASDDFKQFVLLRGDGRVINNGKVGLNILTKDIREKYGDNIHYLYFNGRWESTSDDRKVYLLELCAKQYFEDATIRSVKA